MSRRDCYTKYVPDCGKKKNRTLAIVNLIMPGLGALISAFHGGKANKMVICVAIGQWLCAASIFGFAWACWHSFVMWDRHADGEAGHGEVQHDDMEMQNESSQRLNQQRQDDLTTSYREKCGYPSLEKAGPMIVKHQVQKNIQDHQDRLSKLKQDQNLVDMIRLREARREKLLLEQTA